MTNRKIGYRVINIFGALDNIDNVWFVTQKFFGIYNIATMNGQQKSKYDPQILRSYNFTWFLSRKIEHCKISNIMISI